jgi:hypothetical protein
MHVTGLSVGTIQSGLPDRDTVAFYQPFLWGRSRTNDGWLSACAADKNMGRTFFGFAGPSLAFIGQQRQSRSISMTLPKTSVYLRTLQKSFCISTQIHFLAAFPPAFPAHYIPRKTDPRNKKTKPRR